MIWDNFSIFRTNCAIREIKFDVTWYYVKRQTAKMTSKFVFFSSNPSLNHINIENCLLLFATNTNIFTLLFKELKTDSRLTYDHVTSNLISLLPSAHARTCCEDFCGRRAGEMPSKIFC